MVKVEIVNEKEDERDWESASSASAASASTDSLDSTLSDAPEDESLYDRIAALVDIVPPATRHSISTKVSRTAAFLKWGGKLAGNAVWILTTSALLVGLPLALSLEDEARIEAQEKELMGQQQGQQMLAPGAYGAPSGSNSQQQKGVVPTGF